jgi:HEAT repeat protein
MEGKMIRPEIEKYPGLLYEELIRLAKRPDAGEYLRTFEKYLLHDSPDVQGAALFGLLFVLKRKDENLIDTALGFIKSSEDEALRMMAANCLGEALSNSKVVSVVRNLLCYLEKENDSYVKSACARAVLKICGVDGKSIDKKLNHSEFTTLDLFDIDELLSN